MRYHLSVLKKPWFLKETSLKRVGSESDILDRLRSAQQPVKVEQVRAHSEEVLGSLDPVYSQPDVLNFPPYLSEGDRHHHSGMTSSMDFNNKRLLAIDKTIKSVAGGKQPSKHEEQQQQQRKSSKSSLTITLNMSPKPKRKASGNQDQLKLSHFKTKLDFGDFQILTESPEKPKNCSHIVDV